MNSKDIHKTNTLPSFSKSYQRQAAWGRYIHELLHYKTFNKENKRDLQHQGQEITTILIRMNKYVTKERKKRYNTLD